MVSDDNEPLQSSDVTGTATQTGTTRRRTVVAGLAGAVSLSGCLDARFLDDSDDGESASGDSDDPTGEANTTEPGAPAAGDDSGPDEDPTAAVTAYLEAALEADLDRMSELTHSRNPVDVAALVGEGWEYRGGGEKAELERLEMEVVEDDATVEALLELEGAEYWFGDDDVRDELAAERLATVEVTADEPGSDDAVWVLATEDGAWRYLFQAPLKETPENPEELFEEPIEDEADAVVDEVDWEYDNPMSDVPQVAVSLTDERGIEANRIEVETTIEGAETATYDRDDEEFTATWEGVTLYVPYDTEGDQLVVTAIDEDANESTVVHRERYEPE